MNRRELLAKSAALSVAAVPLAAGRLALGATPAAATPAAGTADTLSPAAPLQAPATGSIPVAFVISDGAVVIDFCGPWSVFEGVNIPGRDSEPFRLYTVAESTSAVTASSGLKILPDFTFKNAPAPKIVVIPAQHGVGEAGLNWIRSATRNTDVTMSVCTGAFVLAQTGLLSGKPATTHHNSYTTLAMQYPDIQLRRGARFVEVGNLATSVGLSSGIDLSLRVVERYFGRDVAIKTAYYMEYQGQGWTDPNSNQVYRVQRASSAAQPLCPVCQMDVDPASAPKSVYRGQTYFFCTTEHKDLFDATPGKFLQAI